MEFRHHIVEKCIVRSVVSRVSIHTLSYVYIKRMTVR